MLLLSTLILTHSLSNPTLAVEIEKTSSWKSRTTPHFEVFHENSRMPADLIYKLESIHNRLKLHLGNFAPWMSEEKTKVYLYKNSKSYLSGEFDPPNWSQGIADLDRRAVALYEPAAKPEILYETLAHELTHLFFEDFFRQKRAKTPRWLTEGLAMLMEEDKMSKSKDQNRQTAMKKFAKADPERMETFFQGGPSEHASAESASAWYLQAYSVTRFLYTRYSQLQFRTFCNHLRSGVPVEKALWLTYRIKDLENFQKEWQSWLKHSVKDSKPFSL